MMNKCNICDNYLRGIKRCKFCNFEYATEVPWTDDSWDILDLDDDIEWSHLQIMYRLKAKGIECVKADIWFDENIAVVVGANANTYNVAKALGVHERCIYTDEFGIKIINLYQEKAIRLGLDKEIDKFGED